MCKLAKLQASLRIAQGSRQKLCCLLSHAVGLEIKLDMGNSKAGEMHVWLSEKVGTVIWDMAVVSMHEHNANLATTDNLKTFQSFCLYIVSAYVTSFLSCC